MKLFASLIVGWLAVSAAGCCHGNKNHNCCDGGYHGGYYGASSCSTCTSGAIPHATLHPTPAPVPADAPAYDAAPMPPQ
jgi:hypothetical protein